MTRAQGPIGGVDDDGGPQGDGGDDSGPQPPKQLHDNVRPDPPEVMTRASSRQWWQRRQPHFVKAMAIIKQPRAQGHDGDDLGPHGTIGIEAFCLLDTPRGDDWYFICECSGDGRLPSLMHILLYISTHLWY